MEKTPEVVIEKDMKDRMKNVKQWFHKVGNAKEAKEFILDFIHKLTTQTDKKPRVIIFFNEKTQLEQMKDDILKDSRFEDIQNQSSSYHGDMDIQTRKKVREDFDKGAFNYLFATNLVARGIDFFEVTCVINCDIPLDIKSRKRQDESAIKTNQIDVQTYIHRVGRAGRSNKKGLAITVSYKEGEDGIIQAAKALDVDIQSYTEFDEIKKHFLECISHNAANKQSDLKQYEKTWLDLGITESMQKHLILKGYQAPKPAQVVSIPKILTFNHEEGVFYSHISVYGFANGRGKTLCFLAPILDQYQSSPKGPQVWSPQIIILAHTKDLCLQIGKILESLIPPEKEYEISYIFKDTETKSIKGSICIGTPGYTSKIMRNIKTNKLKYLVVDEADEVLYSNTDEMKEVISKMYKDKISPGFQMLLFSATFEAVDYSILEDIIDDDDFKQEFIRKEPHFDL